MNLRDNVKLFWKEEKRYRREVCDSKKSVLYKCRRLIVSKNKDCNWWIESLELIGDDGK